MALPGHVGRCISMVLAYIARVLVQFLGVADGLKLGVAEGWEEGNSDGRAIGATDGAEVGMVDGAACMSVISQSLHVSGHCIAWAGCGESNGSSWTCRSFHIDGPGI